MLFELVIVKYFLLLFKYSIFDSKNNTFIIKNTKNVKLLMADAKKNLCLILHSHISPCNVNWGPMMTISVQNLKI